MYRFDSRFDGCFITCVTNARKVPQRTLATHVSVETSHCPTQKRIMDPPHAQIKRWQVSFWSCKSPGRCHKGLAAAIVFSVMYFLNRHTFADGIQFFEVLDIDLLQDLLCSKF